MKEKGADVNQKLFRGHAITAAVREGQTEVVEALLKAGASQPACEEAVVEASLHGRASLAEFLIGTDLVRPRVAVHALILAASRGFLDVVDTLIKVILGDDLVARRVHFGLSMITNCVWSHSQLSIVPLRRFRL